MWKARSSIICQLGFKAETDVAAAIPFCIEPVDRPVEGILPAQGDRLGRCASTHAPTRPPRGEALRRSDPELSGLSKREALKHLGLR